MAIDFINHCTRCAKCRLVDVEKPATLVNCCAEGSSMLRDYLVELKKPEEKKKAQYLKAKFATVGDDGKPTKTTKANAKILTRYKDW